MDPTKQKASVAWLSVISNITLVVLKVIVGLTIGSVSVISEAIHSGVDLLASVIALVAVKKSGKPADENHPFGHGKYENISGTVEALLIFLAAGWIVYEAVQKLIHTHTVDMPGWGVAVMAFSASANWVVSSMLFRVSRKTGSVALEADGWHLRTDVYTSVGVMAGLGAITLGARTMPHVNLQWLDPVVAIFVAALILRAAYRLTVQSARDLLDMNLPAAEEKMIRDLLEEFRPRIRGYHRLRTRKSGHVRFIEFHIFVDANMTVDESHRLDHETAHQIQDALPDSNVSVHVEPCKGNCNEDCRQSCLLTDAQRQTIQRQRKQP